LSCSFAAWTLVTARRNSRFLSAVVKLAKVIMGVLSCYFALRIPRLIERLFDCRCRTGRLRLPGIEARFNEQVPAEEVDGIVVRDRPRCDGAIRTRRAHTFLMSIPIAASGGRPRLRVPWSSLVPFGLDP
jgi:hypothetical protein